jgi:hypothetical protein
MLVSLSEAIIAGNEGEEFLAAVFLRAAGLLGTTGLFAAAFELATLLAGTVDGEAGCVIFIMFSSR